MKAPSKTLEPGLDLIEAAARGEGSLAAMTAATGLSESTAHRLASVLVERNYLAACLRGGYRLGASALRIGFQAQRQIDLVHMARPHLSALAEVTGDTTQLAVLDEGAALTIDEAPGRRRMIVSGRIGERSSLEVNALGNALRDGIAAARTDEDRIHCAAAPIRGVGGAVLAAIGISSADQYIDAGRTAALAVSVAAAAAAIGRDLGWDAGK
jgi:DNA-binding IclR family transcriptional regulator